MPSIEIQTHQLTDRDLRKLTVKITKWLKNQGVNENHVVILACGLEHHVYVGGVPRTENPAIVKCTIGTDRSVAFQQGLATEVSVALRETIGAGWIRIAFDRQYASNTYIFDGMSLWNAAEKTPEILL